MKFNQEALTVLLQCFICSTYVQLSEYLFDVSETAFSYVHVLCKASSPEQWRWGILEELCKGE